jgi:hypothetical protein
MREFLLFGIDCQALNDGMLATNFTHGLWSMTLNPEFAHGRLLTASALQHWPFIKRNFQGGNEIGGLDSGGGFE